MFIRCCNSSSNILAAAHQNTQTVIDATQKETAIDQQHRCEMLTCHHQTILRLLSSAAMASSRTLLSNHVYIHTYTNKDLIIRAATPQN